MSAKSQPVVCMFESRRAGEMRTLVEKQGGIALSAPSMKEVPLENNSEAVSAIRAIVNGAADCVILTTGVGTESMLKLAAANDLENELLQRLSEVPLCVRGPKPAAVVHRLGLKWKVKAPEPNTWRELLDAILAADIALNGQTVAIQEYGVTNPELNAAIEKLGARVLPIPVYRWDLPDDIRPLEAAIQKTISGELDILLFTSAQQARNVLTVADRMDQRQQWLSAANAAFVASIGPTCTEALTDNGLTVHFESSPPKMGPLVRGAIHEWQQN